MKETQRSENWENKKKKSKREKKERESQVLRLHHTFWKIYFAQKYS